MDIKTDKEHKELTDCIINLLETNNLDALQEKILSAVIIRWFLW